MSKEELENLKNEIKEELKSELEESFGKRNPSIWTRYTNDYLEPKLNEMFKSNANIRYQVRTAICTLVRVNAKKRNVINISEDDLEQSKPLIETILSTLERQ